MTAFELHTDDLHKVKSVSLQLWKAEGKCSLCLGWGLLRPVLACSSSALSLTLKSGRLTTPVYNTSYTAPSQARSFTTEWHHVSLAYLFSFNKTTCVTPSSSSSKSFNSHLNREGSIFLPFSTKAGLTTARGLINVNKSIETINKHSQDPFFCWMKTFSALSIFWW